MVPERRWRDRMDQPRRRGLAQGRGRAADRRRGGQRSSSPSRRRREPRPCLAETPPPGHEESLPEAAEELAFSSAGLPMRRRGATLIPGSIAELAGEAPGTSHEATQQDATKVASTLSNLQRGVSRGREASGGWVPKRPDDPEGSNQ